jgi:hypothetical protein
MTGPEHNPEVEIAELGKAMVEVAKNALLGAVIGAFLCVVVEAMLGVILLPQTPFAPGNPGLGAAKGAGIGILVGGLSGSLGGWIIGGPAASTRE